MYRITSLRKSRPVRRYVQRWQIVLTYAPNALCGGSCRVMCVCSEFGGRAVFSFCGRQENGKPA